jgi:serine/threonine protein kinase
MVWPDGFSGSQPLTPVKEDLVGQTTAPVIIADRYRLDEVVGRGGTCLVYSALDQRLDRRVAIKIPQEYVSEGDRLRLVAEARVMATLSHPHLVTVYDAGVDHDNPYVVLELLGSTTLADRTGHPLPDAEVRRIGRSLAEGLSVVHEHGIVHRDVKPANVLVSGRGLVKLGDFGIARSPDVTAAATATGMTVGTAAYLSPEQVRGVGVDTPADVYALGLVLLELLTGRREYPGPAVEAALARLTRPPQIPDDLPAPWPALLEAMTAEDPTSRPTMRDIATILALDGLDTADMVLAPGTANETAVLPLAGSLPRTDWTRSLWPIAAAVAGVVVFGLLAAGLFGAMSGSPATGSTRPPTASHDAGPRTGSPSVSTRSVAATSPTASGPSVSPTKDKPAPKGKAKGQKDKKPGKGPN